MEKQETATPKSNNKRMNKESKIASRKEQRITQHQKSNKQLTTQGKHVCLSVCHHHHCLLVTTTRRITLEKRSDVVGPLLVCHRLTINENTCIEKLHRSEILPIPLVQLERQRCDCAVLICQFLEIDFPSCITTTDINMIRKIRHHTDKVQLKKRKR